GKSSTRRSAPPWRWRSRAARRTPCFRPGSAAPAPMPSASASGNAGRLEFLFAAMAHAIGKIAIEGEDGVGHQRIHRRMQAFDGIAPPGDAREGVLELMQVAQLDDDVEVAELLRAETELAAGHAPAFDEALIAEMAEISRELLGEADILDIRLQIAPDVIEVHVRSPQSGILSGPGPRRLGALMRSSSSSKAV